MSDHLFDVIPVITLWQPWAQWVALGWKPIETRTHGKFASLAGKRIGIHVGQKWDPWALHFAQHFLNKQRIMDTHNREGTFHALAGAPGCIIATAFVKEHRRLTQADEKNSLIECRSQQRWGLVLTDLIVTPFTKAPGKQGIWYHKRPDTLQMNDRWSKSEGW